MLRFLLTCQSHKSWWFNWLVNYPPIIADGGGRRMGRINGYGRENKLQGNNGGLRLMDLLKESAEIQCTKSPPSMYREIGKS